MKTRSLYNPATGVFTGRVVSCSDDQLAANLPANASAVEGRFDRVCQRVDVALLEASRGDHSPPEVFVVDHQPPRPSADHDWSAENPDQPTRAGQRWRWKKKPEVVERERDEQRARRALADLEALDRLSASGRLSAAELSTLQSFRPSAAPSAPSAAEPEPPTKP